MLTDEQCLELGFDRAAFLRIPASSTGDRKVKTDVYLIACGDYVKVGVAVDPKARLHDLQVGNPYDLTLVKTFPHRSRLHALLCERTAHQVLSKFAHHREWFSCSTEHALQVLEAVHAATKTIRKMHIAECRERKRKWQQQEEAKRLRLQAA